MNILNLIFEALGKLFGANKELTEHLKKENAELKQKNEDLIKRLEKALTRSVGNKK